jgi:rod shape-determining protein MreC
MKHFLNSKVRVVLLIAVVLLVAFALLTSLTDFALPQKIVQGALAPVRSGFQTLTRQAEQYYNYMFRYEALAEENAQLRARIAELEENHRSVDSLERENKNLKDLLGLTQARQDFRLMDSYVIGTSSVDWTSTLTIDRGSIDGVEVGLCVVTANGEVVGRITEVGSNYSIVKTVLDSSLEISGTIASSGYNGIVTGAYITGEEGKLRMDYLPSSSIIRNRDQVVTSGSTVYPRDLILGYVIDAGFEETGVAKYALLEPAVELGSLEQIFILMAFENK